MWLVKCLGLHLAIAHRPHDSLTFFLVLFSVYTLLQILHYHHFFSVIVVAVFVTHDIVPSIFSRFLSPNIIMLVYTYILNGICVLYTVIEFVDDRAIPVCKVHTNTILVVCGVRKRVKKTKNG